MEWKVEPLGDIAFMTSGGTPNSKISAYYENGTIPWVRSGELENGAIRDTEIKITQAGLDNSSAKIFPKGTLLIALYGATIGKLAYLDIDACTNQAVCGIFENDNVSLKYLYYFLLFHRPDLVKQGVGGAQSNISQTILKKLMVSYPADQTEQLRIVARIEELFSELDNGVEILRKTKQQLAVYRQAVLKDAFSGCDKQASVSSVCTHVTDGDHMPPPKAASGIPFIMISNIDGNRIDFSDTAFVGRDYYENIDSKRRPQVGDVLYSVTGSFGIPVLVDFEKEFCFQRHIALLRPNDSILSRYLYYAMQAPDVYAQASKGATGTAQKTVGLTVLRKILIPYTESKTEQDQIVRDIENKMSVCDSIEKTVDTALQQAEAMRQSILIHAFERRL